MRHLAVYVHDQLVGDLTEDPVTGETHFAYRSGVAPSQAVSLTMPTDADPSEYQGFLGLPPPFGVHLPEGEMLEALRRRYQKTLNIDDDWDLLALTGRRQGGRVTVGGTRLAPSVDLGAQIEQALRHPDPHGRLSRALDYAPLGAGLSGVMPKLSGYHPPEDRGRRAWVTERQIVKLDTPEYPGAARVEHGCLTALATLGLPVVRSTLSCDERAIFIERFDEREQGPALGFEDACALTGRRRHGKYQGSVRDLFQIITDFIDPQDQERARHTLLDALLVRDLLRDGDGHLKNWGLLYDDPARPFWAPSYDVLNTTLWLPQDQPALPLFSGPLARCDIPNLAHPERAYTPHWFTAQDWPVLARWMATDTQTIAHRQHVLREGLQEAFAAQHVSADTALGRALTQLGWNHVVWEDHSTPS